MMNFSKEELTYYDYDWTNYPSDSPQVSGKPGDTSFNKHEGEEVLYLIRKIIQKHHFKNKVTGKRAEIILHDLLPDSAITQLEAEHWVEKHWTSIGNNRLE